MPSYVSSHILLPPVDIGKNKELFYSIIIFFICHLFCFGESTLSIPYALQQRVYYIAAEEVQWDYAPSGKNQIKPEKGLGVWGKKLRYAKTRYIEYTDATFTKKKPQPEYLGIMGPILRACVGDTIIVHFRNRGKKPYSIHPHGLHYDKDNEGAGYAGMQGKGSSIKPGEEYRYVWSVLPRSGPGPEDSSSIIWLYHSHVHPVQDVNAGLIGPIIISLPGASRKDASPSDVDREIITLFQIFDENSAGAEEEGNIMHGINGYIFGNIPGLVMDKGEKVRWYLIGLGNEVDLHTPHWHGETVLHEGRRKDVVELLPGSMYSVDMFASNPGTWLFHCHVSDHIIAGMIGLFTVKNP